MRARRRSWERRAAAGARPPAFRSGDRTGTTNERTRERGGESSTRRYPSRKRFRTRICHHKLVLLRVACRQLLILRWPKHSRGYSGPMRGAPARSQIPQIRSVASTSSMHIWFRAWRAQFCHRSTRWSRYHSTLGFPTDACIWPRTEEG